ncbi:hypothetical protein [Rhizobium ruizarguesonis]|uniref:hypothetical protein n=1 Tax=Rhizobium ruizarguesonis TaxID=2081791 RepID=UPI0010316F9A|nr:hypothetical protein [Rhizobium ruizarguesonis]TBE08794.1 hypothetical protein ELH12_23415 [Rhizobium ruizarguesonis]
MLDTKAALIDLLRDLKADPAIPISRYDIGVPLVGKVEDTRKKWWGRAVEKKRTASKPVAGSGMKGPGHEALSMLERWVTKRNGTESLPCESYLPGTD